jgi:hypothetical protein
MEASLTPPWWKKLGLLGVLTVIGVLAGAAYIFDPPARELGSFSGHVLSITVTENPKTGFRQLAMVRLASGEVIQAAMPSTQRNVVPVGAHVTVYEFASLLFHKRTYRAELIALRPNNSFKPNPLRGSA